MPPNTFYLYRDTLELIELFHNNNSFKTRFLELLDRPRVRYKGRPLKMYVRVIANIDQQYSAYTKTTPDKENFVELLEKFYLNQRGFSKLARDVVENTHILPEQEHSEIAGIEKLPDGEQKSKAFENFLSKKEKEEKETESKTSTNTQTAPSVPNTPQITLISSIPQQNTTFTPTTSPPPSQRRSRIIPKIPVQVERVIQKYTTPMRLTSGLLSIAGGTVGFLTTHSPIGTLIGAGLGAIGPTALQNGGFQALGKAGNGALNMGGNLLEKALSTNPYGRAAVIAWKTRKIVIAVVVAVIAFLLILIPGGLLDSSALLPPYQQLATVPAEAGELVKITKTGPSHVEVTDNINYEISVTYLGTGQADLTVSDQIPDKTDFVSAPAGTDTPEGALSGSTITWTLPKLQANKLVKIALTVKPKENNIYVINNGAGASVIKTYGNTPTAGGAGGSCPTQAEINANKQSPQTCKYFGLGVDIFDTTLSQITIDSYVNQYGSIFVNGSLGDLNEFRRRVHLIISKSQSVGLNPIIFLGYWRTESAFGTIRNAATFGCAPGQGVKSFDIELNCAVGLNPSGTDRGGSLTSRCASPNNPTRQQDCNSLKFSRDSRPDLYANIPVVFPISTFDDFAETFGSRAPTLDGPGTTNRNCTSTYNLLVEVINSVNACKVTSPTTTTNSSTQSNGYSIVLDPGHGNPDLTPEDKTPEGALNLIIANKLKTKLESEGYQVSLTHNSNIPISSKYDELTERVNRINSSNADILVSIHFDNGSYPYSGPRAYYNTKRPFSSQSSKLAQSIGQSLSITTGLTTAGQVTGIDEDPEVAGCSGPLYILGPKGTRTCPDNPESEIRAESKMPGSLVEMFIQQPYSAIGSNTPLVDKIVSGYNQGIVNYFK